MTDTTITKPRISVNWERQEQSPEELPDFGTWEPDLPFETDPPEREPDRGLVSATLSDILTLCKGDIGLMRTLLSPDMGIKQGSYSRPDLYPALALAKACLEAVQHELRHGPKRTRWNPETQQWDVVIPNAEVSAQLRKEGRLPRELPW